MASAVVFAYHDVGCRCLAALLDCGVDVPLVITHHDDPGENVWFGSVEALARGRGIETIMPEDPNDPSVVNRVLSLGPDFLFSFYYRLMLGQALLDAPRFGAYNVHGSLLPKFAGRAPVNWAIIQGETETGATLHQMAQKPDAGRIVDQEAVPILPDDLAIDVFHKVTDAAERVVRRSVPRLLSGSAVLRAQDFSRRSYFGGRRPEDGRIDWLAPAKRIHDLVRGVAPPYPGAFTEMEGARLGIHRTRLRSEKRRSPAAAHLFAEAHTPFAACVDGEVLELISVELDGSPLSAPEFAERIGSRNIPLQPKVQ